MRPPTRALAIALILAAAAYLGAALYLFLFQRDYVFKPGGAVLTPAAAGLPEAETVSLQTADGTPLAGWYVPAGMGRPTLLYFHGNAGNFSDRAERFRQILGSGLGLLTFSYRGYPGSGGAPSEAGLESDALQIFDWLAARTPDIVIYGESLGTGVATYLAANREARALVLEAPFTAALDLAAAAYPWIPTGLLMRDPFLSRETIKAVDEPLLVIHGTLDRTVPVEQGKRLFALAQEPKKLVIIDGAGHGDLWKKGLWRAVVEFLQAEKVIAAVRPDRPAKAGGRGPVYAAPIVRRMPSRAGA